MYICKQTKTNNHPMKDEARLQGANVNFRCPDEVSRVIDEYVRNLKDAWVSKGRQGQKPSKDEVYTMLLRKGIKHTPSIKIYGEWNEDVNKVYVMRKVERYGMTFTDLEHNEID